MPTARRPKPYVWVTWATKILAGENHCRYALWFKGNHTYDKREESPESTATLAAWNTDHAAMVQQRAATLALDNYDVQIEGQNRFKVGTHVTLAGAADIVGLHRAKADALVIDCKTGKRRESDYWQVLTYLAYLPIALKELAGRTIYGEVAYIGGPPRTIMPAEVTPEVRSAVTSLMKTVTGRTVPKTTPSYSECRFCDIAACPDRKVSQVPATAIKDF